MNPDALQQVDDARLEAELLDRPIASLRDLQYTYGTLYELAFDVDDEYFQYYTPCEFAAHVGQPESVIAVEVDAIEETVEGVTVTEYSEELVPKVAHTRSDSSRDIDHSITHQSKQSPSTSYLQKRACRRLTDWPQADLIQAFLDDDPADGWIIEVLERVGRDEDELETVREEVSELVDGSNPALLTVRVRTESDGEFRWPGEIDVLNRALKYRWRQKQSRKNVDDRDPSARGEGPGQVLGDNAAVLAGTASDPLNYFRSKQREQFPSIDRRDAWLAHPISEKATARIQNAKGFIEACYHSTFGLRAYHLPYIPETLNADSARILFRFLVTQQDADDDPLARAYRSDKLDRFRFYTIALEYYQKDTYRVYHDDVAASALPLADVAAVHHNVVVSGLFGDDGSAPFPAYDGHHSLVERSDTDRLSLVDDDNSEATWYDAVASGQYVFETFPDPLADSDNDITADDPRIVAYRRLLQGKPLTYRFLIDNYLALVENRERNPDIDGFPTHVVAQQLAQLCALDRAGMLTHEFPLDARLFELRAMSETTDDPDQTRSEKLDVFIENAPLLAENTPYEATFLAGAAVGFLSRYQSSPKGADVSRTVRDKYPVNKMTTNRLREAVTEVIDRNNVYSSRNDRRLMYADVIDHLRETLLNEPIDDWEVSKTDLRYVYGLGLTYGLTDRSSSAQSDPEKTGQRTDAATDA